ncbi:MAG: carbamoyl phosphate synthase large subunit, partial [Thermodesulfovibrionales bacterium]|nr:carbamoyl phosphate synthase large subunit [Thermodesulfovibrionales bacterium]
VASKFYDMGFNIIATKGTAKYLKSKNIKVKSVKKISEGSPNIVDLIKNKEIHFVINTISGAQAQKDSFSIRQSAIQYKVPFTTTISGAIAAVNAIEKLKKGKIHIKSIQEYHKGTYSGANK